MKVNQNFLIFFANILIFCLTLYNFLTKNIENLWDWLEKTFAINKIIIKYIFQKLKFKINNCRLIYIFDEIDIILI